MGTHRRTGSALVAVCAVLAVLAALLVGVAPARAASAQPGWAPFAPAARSDTSMVYDPTLGQLVLFGGADTNASLLDDTWTTNGTTWTEASPTASPPARSDQAMAFDPNLGTHGEVVLFGGIGSGPTTLSDTWAYNGTTWTNLTPASPATSPPARAYASMAYDPALGQLVLFGGSDSGGNPLFDTWAFNGTAWTALTPTSSPPARSSATMAYDAAASSLVLFGGQGSGGALADTWSFNGTTWTALTPASSPPARSSATMAYDASTSTLVLFGGFGGSGATDTTLADTWSYNGTTWSAHSPSQSPPGRSYATMDFDAATNELVLFGGLDAYSNTLGDTWLSNGTTWVPAAPPSRSDSAMAYDTALGEMVLFGGINGANQALADTWTSTNGTTWVEQVPTVSPPGRSYASMGYDSASGQLVLFGGLDTNQNTLGDTWVYSQSGSTSTWTELNPAASPGPRSDAQLTYDPTLSALVLFGGLDEFSNTLSDLWTFNGTTWVAKSPAPRSDYAAAYDQATGQLVVFSGLDVNSNTLSDTWVYNGSWTELSTPSPPGRSFASMAYDPKLGQVVLFGGLDTNDNTLGDTWTFNGTSWTEQSPAYTPSPRSDAPLTYDAALGQLVLFGGLDVNGNALQDTWTYNGVTWGKVTSSVNKPSPRSDFAMAYDPALSQLVLFGGLDALSNTLSDTWTFNGAKWTQSVSTPAPPGRSFAQMAYDSATNQLVLYGGVDTNDNTLGDEWTYGASGWTAQTTTALPSARSDATMVYDTATSRLLLLGGLDPNVNTLGDLWSGAGTTWTAASPPARSDGAMAYDNATNQVVLYGGLDVNSNTLGDTWTLTGTTWSPVNSTNAPSARAYTEMAYDPATSQLVLFGGLDNNSNTLGDEWTYSAAGWTAQTTTTLPSARSDADLAFDPTSGQLVLFGGLDVNGSPLADTWTTVNPLSPQSVAFTSDAPSPAVVGGPTYTPAASATSDLPVAITLDTSSTGCALNAGVVTFTASGTCVLDANQSGNSSYAAANQVQQSITVVAPQSVAFTSNAPSPAVVGGPTYTPAASATSDLPVAITLDTSSTGCTLNAGVVTFTASGTCVLDANQSGNSSYAAANQVQQSITVVSPQSVAFTSDAPSPAVVGGPTYTPAASATSDLPVAITLDTSSTGCALNAGVVTFTASGTCVLDANQSGNSSYGAANQAQQSITVVATQSVAFTSGAPSPAVVGGPTYTPAASATSDLPVAITLDTSSTGCTLNAGVVTFTASGTCVLDANQSGNSSYGAANQVQQSITVVAPQSVAFTSNAPSPAVVGGPTYTPAASATSDLPVAITLDTSSTGCTLNAGVVTFTAIGTCVLDANQSGNSSYAAANQVQQSITVVSPQSVAFTSDAPSPAVVGGPTYTPAASATSDLPVAITLDTSSTGCTLNAGVVTFTAIGTCVLDANQSGNSSYAAANQVQQSITVVSPQSVAFTSNAPSPAVVGGPTYTPAASATSDLPVAITLDTSSTGCTLNAGVVTFTAIGTCLLDANQSGNSSFAAANQVQQSIPVLGLCAPGYFSMNGSPPCTPAPVGTYVPTAGATAPTNCPTGTYTLAQGAASAAACVTLIVTNPGGKRSYVYAPVAALGGSTSNGVGAVIWKASGLPPGLLINALTGSVTGTPTGVCSCSVVLTATDAEGHTGTATFTWTILPFGVATTSLPPAVRGTPFGPVQLAAGGTSAGASLKWSKGARLPKGLKLTSTGVLSGTPSTKLLPGTTSVSVVVTETVIRLEGTKRVKTKTIARATIPLHLT